MTARRRAKSKPKRRPGQRSAGEYFGAALGIAVLVFLAALVVPIDACSVESPNAEAPEAALEP